MFVTSLRYVCDVVAICLCRYCDMFVMSLQCLKLVDLEIGHKHLFFIIISEKTCFTSVNAYIVSFII